MSSQLYGRVSGVVFLLVAVAHAWRAASGLPIMLGSVSMPIYCSWFVAVIAAGLSMWGLRMGK